VPIIVVYQAKLSTLFRDSASTKSRYEPGQESIQGLSFLGKIKLAVLTEYIINTADTDDNKRHVAQALFERVASNIIPSRKSDNFMYPVDME
jgi:hypothetical protein